MRWVMPFFALLAACKGSAGEGNTDAAGDDDDTTEPTTDPDVVPPGCDAPLPLEPVVELYPASLVEVDGVRFSYWLPPQPRGVVYVFHGSGGDITTVNNPQWWQFYNMLYCARIAVGITESDRSEWDLTYGPGNTGMARQETLRALLADEGVGEDLPTFGVGFSNGGQFTTLWMDLARDAGWDVRGVSIHNSSGAGVVPDLPANYQISENDDNASNPTIRSLAADHAASGLPGGLYEATEKPISRTYFLMLDGFDEQDAAYVFDDLLAAGYIDEQGNRLVPTDGIERQLNSWQDRTRAPGAARVTNELRARWATHRFNAEWAAEDVALFVDQL